MNESVVFDDRERLLVKHACGFGLFAYPIKVGNLVRAGFAAQCNWRIIERGQTVDHCPKCGEDLQMSWEDAKMNSAGAYRV